MQSDHALHDVVLDSLLENPNDVDLLLYYKELSAISVRTTDFETLRDVLGRMDSLEAISHGIDIVSDLGFHAASEQGDATQRVDLDITEFFSSQDDAVRMAALASLQKHPRDDQATLLQSALTESAPAMREMAIAVIGTHAVADPAIIDELFLTTQSAHRSPSERQMALGALYAIASVDDETADRLQRLGS